MSGLISINVSEARGFTAIPADIDRLAVVLGCSTAGDGLSSFFLSGSSAVDEVGYGDAVDTLCQIIEQRQLSGSAVAKVPAALYTLPVTTAGSYGAIDTTGVTGLASVSVDSTVHPSGTFETRLKWILGGTVGTTGMLIQHSSDGGRTYSNTIALGTATSYTIPNTNAKFDFSPSSIDLTALNTLLNEIKTDFNAHAVLIAGGVHGAADNADVVATANASNTATRIALANALRAAYEAHRIKTAGGVHGSADTTNVTVAPVATDDTSALVLALDLKAKYNAHRILTAGAVHGLADSTNVVSSAAPAAGTFATGDIVACRTIAPAPSTGDVDTAFTDLAAASADFSLIVCDFDCDAAMAAHITTGLNALKAVGKRCAAIIKVRIPDAETDETDAAWLADVAADYASFTDSRICKRASYGLVTDAMTTRQYLRSDIAQFAADVVRVGRAVWPCSPSDQAMGNFTLVDSDGVTVGHDEGVRGASTGLSNEGLGNTFSCVQRLPDPTRRESVFNCVPWVAYDADERIRNLMTRRLANAMERVAVAAATPSMGGRVFYVSTGPTTGTLTAASRKALQGTVYRALAAEFGTEIDNAADAAIDTGLVQIAPSVTVSGGNLLEIDCTLAPRIAGYVLTFNITLALQE